MLHNHNRRNADATGPPKVSVVATLGNPDSASASSRVFAAHPILRRSLDTLLAQGAPDYPVLPIFQQTRTGGFVDDARHPPLSFQRGDARMLSNNLEPGPVVPDFRVLPPKIAPDPSSFVVRLPGDIEIALHRSVEAYHDLQPAPSSPFVHGFNGLPGLGPWSIAGVIRITNNKATALQHLSVSLDLSANMASKNLVKAAFENVSGVDFGTPLAPTVAKHLLRWRMVQPSLHRFQIQKLGPRESFYASFRYVFTQVYPPSVDLIALNLNESATNTHYRLTVEVVVPRKGLFGDDGIVSLTKDISVFMYSKPQIADVLQSALRKRVETMQARAPEFPWKLSLAHSHLAPSDTAFLDITVGALLGTSTLPEITAVTVEIVEVIGYLRGESKFDKSKKVHTHATQKVCERYKFAPPTSNPSASSNTLLPLSWTRDDSPQLPDTTASQTALLRFATPPLVVDRRDAVPSPLSAKQDPQYPASCMNPDGRWHDAVIAHDLRVVLHVLDEKRRAVEVEGVMAVSVIGVRREEVVRLVDAYPGLLEDIPMSDATEDLPTEF
ncbi:hypothetical protein DFJ73DRAFT_766477 [Zopfochytrium polystomum]|nr:hypothetical protein DFJ73DRAFT_766477 [Zopfochytrium polystomum]